MKKQLTGILTAVLVFSFGATSAFAAGRGCHFQDTDNNGVCDFAGTACAYADQDGDGICDYCGMSRGDDNWYGIHHAYEDYDGVCPYAGSGYGHHSGYGRHGRHCR